MQRAALPGCVIHLAPSSGTHGQASALHLLTDPLNKLFWTKQPAALSLAGIRDSNPLASKVSSLCTDVTRERLCNRSLTFALSKLNFPPSLLILDLPRHQSHGSGTKRPRTPDDV
ncbi:hypothetical protein T440DRAFT_523830 [Plenodomus tracheiphilus IPT5]|uniref:Uncharacterized protein n=1 Tax=Plenodomus tracheiphilus IPT5 TaxID=1408161 RepID=A0A6A7APA4_9PLEO|nr:hypothetical protein T440DRAFT_523830 [Plenodomus tracheiphilus IPT5]